MLKITKNQGSIQVTADKSGFYPFDGTITFPTNSLFTATSANTDMITFKSTSNGDVQFVGNYKDITISGRSYDTKQKFLTAFSNLANQGSVDAYTKAETDAKLNDKLTAKTNAKDALFIRSYSNNDASSSLALYDSTVKGTNDVAIGLASTSSKEGSHNLAMLNRAQANGRQNIAIGDQRRCDGDQNIGIGCGKYDTIDVNGTGNVCVGANSQAHTDNNTAVNDSIAIGSDAKAGAYFCTVIGKSAHSKSSHSVAVGDNAYVEHDCDFSVAVGDSATAYGKGCVAIGRTSNATNVKPLDICCGQRTDGTPLSVIQSDENGKISLLKGDGTDERIVIQDALSAGGGGSVDAYTKAETDTKLEAKQDKLTAGSGITITKDETAGTSTIATAVSLTDNGNGNYQVGNSIKMGYGIAIGTSATSPRDKSIAIGDNAKSIGSENIAIGKGVNCDSAYSVIIGSSATSNVGGANVAVGSSATSNGGGSIAIGYKTSANNYEAIAIGSNAVANDTYSLAIGYEAKAVTDKPMVIKAGGKTMIQGDANGKISIPLGDGTASTMCLQDEITALKNAGGSGGTVDAYTRAETDNLLNAKQNTLTAGSGITIDENNVISSTGGSGGSANPYVNVNGTGDATIADGVTNAVAIGSRTEVTKGAGIAVGDQSRANGRYCVSIGRLSTSIGDSTVAVGDNAKSMNTNSVAIGSSATAFRKNSVGIGYQAGASGESCISIGNGAKTDGTNGVAIGSNSSATSDIPLVIKAGVDVNGSSLPMIQGNSTGKISIPLGDGSQSTMCLQDEIAALKAEIAALKGGASTGA